MDKLKKKFKEYKQLALDKNIEEIELIPTIYRSMGIANFLEVYSQVDSFEELLERAEYLMSTNSRLEAVKMLYHTGLFNGLAEAKDFFEKNIDQKELYESTPPRNYG